MLHGINSSLLTTFYRGDSKYTNRLTTDHLGLLFLALGFSREQYLRNGFAWSYLIRMFQIFLRSISVTVILMDLIKEIWILM